MNIQRTLPLLFALTLASCGSSPAPRAKETVVPTIAAPVEEVVVPAEAPLSDVAPKDMAMRIHAENLEMSWKNAERLVRHMGAAIPSLPPDLLATGLLGPSITSVIDMAGPVDLGFFGTEFNRFAVGIPVAAEMQPRLGKLFQLKLRRGIWHIVGNAGDEESGTANGSLAACAFVGVEEESGARVVCASDEELLEASALYLGRTVLREGRDGDVRLELLGSALFEEMANDANAGNTNSWAEATGERYAATFFRDIRQLSLIGSWGKPDVDAEILFDFRPGASGFSRAISTRVPLQSPSAESFARLPKDALVAMHGDAGSSQALAPMRDEFLHLLAESLESDGYDPDLLSTFNKRVSDLFFTGGSYAWAYGVDHLGAEKALAAYAKDKKKPALRSAAYRSLRGWAMFAVDEPAEKWTKGIEEIVRVGNEMDKKRNGGIPVTSATPIKPKNGGELMSTTMTVVTTPAGLPKNSLHVEMKSKPLKKEAPPAYTKHLYVVPDGSRTWISFGEQEAPMLARLKAAREGLSDQTIAGAPDLARTAAQGAVAAGFFTLAGGTFLFLDDERDEQLDKAVIELESLSTLPGRGDGVIPFQIMAEDEQNGGNRARVKTKLSLPVLADIAEMVRR